MSTVRHLLREKAKEIWSIAPEATVFQAITMMAEKNVGALLVIEKDQLVGIFSERDYARKVALKNKSSSETKVEEVMSKDVKTVTCDMTLEECMQLITDKYIRHLPVVENGRLVGIVTIGDVVRKIISDQKITIEAFSDYVSGREYGFND